MQQQKVVSSLVAVLIVLSLLAVSIQAYPSRRAKRVSDQRLAELQTMLALARLKSRLPTKVGGYVDVTKIGRKKRSHDDLARTSDYDRLSSSPSDDELGQEVDWSYYDDVGRFDRG